MASPMALAQILECFLSPDRTIRTDAEAAFNQLKEADSDGLLRGILGILAGHSEVTLRQQAAVAIRSVLRDFILGKSNNIWTKLAPETRSLLKTSLLGRLQAEQSKLVRNTVCDTLSDLASELVALDDWPELPPQLMQLVRGSTPEQQAAGLKILSDLVPQLSSIIRSNKDGLAQVIVTCMQSPDAAVRLEALSLISALVQSEQPSTWKPCQAALPYLVNMIQEIARAHGMTHGSDDVVATDIFARLTDIADSSSAFFRPEAAPFVQALLAVARDVEADDETRQMATEVLICMAEDKPKMCLRIPNFVHDVVGLLIELMLTIEDDPEWIDKETSASPIGGDQNDDEDAGTRNYDVGENGLDRIASALGGENVMATIFGYVSLHLRKPEWQHKLVAIMAISQTVEYLPEDSAETHLDEIIDTLLAHLVPPTDVQLNQSHHRIRFVACQALGQIALDHRPYVQHNYADKVLPGLIATLDDPFHRVQAHAAAALVNFIEEVDPAELAPFSDQLMEKLLQKLAAPETNRVTREQCITNIACIAGVFENEFVKFYPVVMPIMSRIISNSNAKEEVTLKGKAIECVSIIALSVNPEVFKESSAGVMEAMLAVQQQAHAPGRPESEDDQIKDYLQEAFCRFCRAMNKDFVPYLPRLVPGLLTLMAAVPQTLEAEEAADQEDMTLVTIAGGKYNGLKTTVIQEIIQATDMLHTFIQVLGADFGVYLQPAAAALLPLLSFPFSDDVKRSALDSMAEVLAASRAAGADLNIIRTWLATVLEKVFEDLSPATGEGESFTDIDLMVAETGGVGKCLRNAGSGVLTGPQVAVVCEKVFALMRESSQRRAEIATRKGEPECDEEDVSRLEDEESAEQTLRSTLLEIIAAFMKFHPQEFMQTSAPSCKKFIETHLHPNCTADDRALALYVCDDILEHLKNVGASLWPSFIERMVASLRDPAPSVRQAAAYGFIHAVQCGQFPDQALQIASQRLGSIISDASHASRMASAEQMACDNAVAALGAILMHRSAVLQPSPAEYLTLWIDALPLKADEEEGQRVHNNFMTLLLKSPSDLLGPDNVHLPKITAICAAIYKSNFSNATIDEAIRRFLSSIGFDVISSIGANFDKKHKKALERIHRDVAAKS